MRIAVTGGSGKIGRAVIELAARRGHDPVNLDRTPPPAGSAAAAAPFVPLDVTDYGAVEAALAGCGALVHLAAIPQPGGHPDHVVHHTNVVGSYNALRAAAGAGVRRVCQASSVNAIGHCYSRRPRYDYFPVDEAHPTSNEDPYSLSKWVCEAQADSIARRYEGVAIASLRFHWVTADPAASPGREYAADPATAARYLGGYTRLGAAADACLLALAADFAGHEAFFVVAPDTAAAAPSDGIAREFYPEVLIRRDLTGRRSFFDSAKAERVLGWRHG